MPTFLTTPKMSPELRARIDASVRGRRAAPGARLAPRSLGLLRVVLIVTIVGSISWLFVLRQRSIQERETQRAALLAQVLRESASLTDAQRQITARVQSWLERGAATYEGDHIAEKLRSGDALAATLSRSGIYVRGALASFLSASGTKESAATSSPDAFVLCLIDPPATRSEKTLLVKARAALGRGVRMEPTAHVQRLYHALAGLPFLSPAWSRRVTEAETEHDIVRLERTFKAAPLKAAKLAAQASLLLFAMDEADGTGPTELDGERAHHVRVGLVDLDTDQLLFRLRRHVDPSWISPTVRAEYASGIDACSLAGEVRAAVTEKPVTASQR